MHEIERHLQVIWLLGRVVLVLHVCISFHLPPALHIMYHRRQLRLSLYVKAVICVGCALSRGRKERRTNTNNGKNSNPELSKKSEIEGGNGQDTCGIKKYERTTYQRDTCRIPTAIVGVRISLDKRPARKAHYSPSNLPEANGSVGA